MEANRGSFVFSPFPLPPVFLATSSQMKGFRAIERVAKIFGTKRRREEGVSATDLALLKALETFVDRVGEVPKLVELEVLWDRWEEKKEEVGGVWRRKCRALRKWVRKAQRKRQSEEGGVLRYRFTSLVHFCSCLGFKESAAFIQDIETSKGTARVRELPRSSLSGTAAERSVVLGSRCASKRKLETIHKQTPRLLLSAVRLNHVESVRLLVREGVDLERDEIGGPALMHAASCGYADCIQVLLDGGADVRQGGERGDFALMRAAYNGHADCVQVLLRGGADVHQRDENGFTAIMDAACNGHAHCIQVLLKGGADVHQQEEKGGTALMLAAFFGHADCIQVLLRGGADVHKQSEEGFTPLVFAAVRGHADCVQVLLDGGADVDQQNEKGITALMMAAHCGRADCVQVLLDGGADVHQQLEDGFTALMAAAREGHTDCVQVLLDGGADVRQGSKQGFSALILAASQGHTDCVQLLLKGGADVHQRDENGFTALMGAADNGHADCIQVLLDGGADMRLQDEKGCSALMRAAFFGHADCIQVLLDGGADVRQRCKRGFSALIFAARQGHTGCIQALLQFGRHPRVEHGNVALDNALLVACYHAHEDCALLILEMGARQTRIDVRGNTPLIWATVYGMEQCVKALVDQDPEEIYWKNNCEYTALAIAIAGCRTGQPGYFTCAFLILQAGMRQHQSFLNEVKHSRL